MIDKDAFVGKESLTQLSSRWVNTFPWANSDQSRDNVERNGLIKGLNKHTPGQQIQEARSASQPWALLHRSQANLLA